VTHHDQERVETKDQPVGNAEQRGAADPKELTCAACPAGRLFLLPRMLKAAFAAALPVPVARHLRNARRETLLAARCLLDQMLAMQPEPADKTRRKIEIE